MTEVLLRAGTLPSGQVVDIHVRDGLVSSVTDAASDPATVEVVDLAGWLLLPPLAEPHAHLDKTLTAERIPNPAGDLLGAVVGWEQAMTEGWFGPDDIAARASVALDRLIVNGVTAVRTHVNVSETVGATGVAAMCAVAAEYRELVDVQIVALATPPMTGPEGAGNRAALDAALEAGADLVGGAPQLDPDPERQIDHALAVATAAGTGVDLHIDETLDPEVLTLRYLARRVVELGFASPVTASHCVSLSVQDLATQRAVAGEVAAAGISIVALPHTNLFLQGRDHPVAMPRGLTAVGELQKAGVVVSAGADNVEDPYNPVGRSDPLETAALMIMTGHRRPDEALAMVSDAPRQTMGLPATRFAIGDPADFVAVRAASVREAIARAPGQRSLFRGGRLVASSTAAASIGDRPVDGGSGGAPL